MGEQYVFSITPSVFTVAVTVTTHVPDDKAGAENTIGTDVEVPVVVVRAVVGPVEPVPNVAIPEQFDVSV
jgi:hypothetical protein